MADTDDQVTPGAEDYGAGAPIRVGAGVSERADAGLDGRAVAHGARLQGGQQGVVVVPAPGGELGERIDLGVGDVAAGQLAGRAGRLVTAAAALGDHGAVTIDDDRADRGGRDHGGTHYAARQQRAPRNQRQHD